LHAPLRVIIYADKDCDTYLAVDQPSNLFASYGNPDITEVGKYLDQLLDVAPEVPDLFLLWSP
jgi:uncharacterized protein (DUF302 family)